MMDGWMEVKAGFSVFINMPCTGMRVAKAHVHAGSKDTAEDREH